jgi:hypothetical protein
MAKRRQAAQVRRDQSFKGRQFTTEVILWAVRWYLMFPISYRDLELMLLDRDVEVDHTTHVIALRKNRSAALRSRLAVNKKSIVAPALSTARYKYFRPCRGAR